MKMALALCHQRGRFLFEARPDLFPEGRLTDVEGELWGMFSDYMKHSEKQGR